jgi:hypothetical protein
MPSPFRAKPYTRSIIQPQPSALGLFRWHFQPFPSPDPFDPFVIHSPTFVASYRATEANAICDRFL